MLLFTAGDLDSHRHGVRHRAGDPSCRAPNLNETLKTGGRSGAIERRHNRLRSLLWSSRRSALATVALDRLGPLRPQHAGGADDGPGLRRRSTSASSFLNPGQQHYDQAHGLQFYVDAVAARAAVPGVEAAAVRVGRRRSAGGILLTVFPEGEAQDPNYRGSLVAFNDITPGYFETLRIPMRGGRDFTEFDREGTTLVAIVNQAIAKQLWPGQDAIGKRFTIVSDPKLYEVVGVAATHVINTVGEDPTPDDLPADAAGIRARGGADRAHERAIRRRCRRRCAIRCRRSTNMPMRGHRHGAASNIEQGLWAPRMGAGAAQHLRRRWRCCSR